MLTEEINPRLRERFQATWAGCLGGAVPEEAYWHTVKEAGFADVTTVSRHILTSQELTAMASCPGEEFTPAPAQEDLAVVQGNAASVKFTAIKPH